MTDMGDVSLVLGIQITRDREKKTLTISQEEFTKSILERFGMANFKPVGTSGFGSELSTKQPEETLLSKEKIQRYQTITGSVMYLAQILRYDIVYSSGQLARAMSRPAKVWARRSIFCVIWLEPLTSPSSTRKEVSNALPSRIQTGVTIPTMASQLRGTSSCCPGLR